MKNEYFNNRIIPDPDFEEFNGLFAGAPSEVLPPSEYHLTNLVRYLKKENKNFSDLSEEELNQFKI